MAYAPDMGAAAPAPTWMGGHSSIEQPTNPFVMQLVQWLMQQQGQGGRPNLDPTFNMPRPGAGPMPMHPGGGDNHLMEGLNPLNHGMGIPRHGIEGQPLPHQLRVQHVGEIAQLAKRLAGNVHRSSGRFNIQPFLRRV